MSVPSASVSSGGGVTYGDRCGDGIVHEVVVGGVWVNVEREKSGLWVDAVQGEGVVIGSLGIG